jgi:hypothetical protein
MTKKKILSALLVASIAVPAAAYAARERGEVLRAERELETFTSAVAPGADDLNEGTERLVTLNGAPLYFKKSSTYGTVSEVMARVAKECASGNESSAFGLTRSQDDGTEKPIRLERVVTQEGTGGAHASLCIFANEHGASDDEVHRVRWTLAVPRHGESVSLTTVVNASSTPIQELFPLDGDAPGSDPEGVPRPEEARRTMTATVGRNGYVVRVYESTLPVSDSISRYDRAMHRLGFVTTGSLEEGRIYDLNGQNWVASFRATTGGSTVALAPFHSLYK